VFAQDFLVRKHASIVLSQSCALPLFLCVLVVKIGTSLVAPGGRSDTGRLRALVDQLDLSRHEFLIVSSGAIGSGDVESRDSGASD
jgi:hypothetical protein